MRRKPEIPDKVIVIGGLPRSGKSLMAGVLGSHSQIAVPTSALNFFRFFSDEQFNARGGFQENLEYFFESGRKARPWDISRSSVAHTGDDQRDLYLTLLDCFRRTHFPEKKYVGEYTHMIEEHFDRLVEWFGLGRLKFLQIIRNPYDNFASRVIAVRIDPALRESKSPDAPVHQFCNSWSQSAAMGMARALRYPESYRTLFFDQIKETPTDFIESLCEWLGVPPEVEAMLHMVDRTKKRHNTAFELEKDLGEGVGYVRKDSYDRRKHLNDYELATIRAMSCPNMLNAMGYEKETVTVDWRRPKPVVISHYSSRLASMIRSYLSPATPRHALSILVRSVVGTLTSVMVSYARRKLLGNSVRRRSWSKEQLLRKSWP